VKLTTARPDVIRPGSFLFFRYLINKQLEKFFMYYFGAGGFKRSNNIS